MTFYIPPVFLFGNNANRFHNNEEKKSEYKTAAETEIKVENWREKRIAELEEENRDLVEKIEKLLWEKIKLEEEIRSLELENRAMKVESEDLKMWLREKLPLALLKEYMDKFEWVDLKNV